MRTWPLLASLVVPACSTFASEPDANTPADAGGPDGEAGAPVPDAAPINDAPVDAVDAGIGKLVFISKGKFTPGPGVNRRADADLLCVAEAAAAGRGSPGFVAWLSAEGEGMPDAIMRITSDGPWVRADGAGVFANKAGLATGTLQGPIAQHADKMLAPDVSAWTGTKQNGTADPTCQAWTNNGASPEGTVGRPAAATDANWTAMVTEPCNVGKPVICFEP